MDFLWRRVAVDLGVIAPAESQVHAFCDSQKSQIGRLGSGTEASRARDSIKSDEQARKATHVGYIRNVRRRSFCERRD
jgi:hypothetical protein